MTVDQRIPAQPSPAIRCGRCGTRQPVARAGPVWCVACGAPVLRWYAHPPPGLNSHPTGATRSRQFARAGSASTQRRPYLGPPSYGSEYPRWGYRPVAFPAPAPQAPRQSTNPVPALRLASRLAAVTTVVALVAAGSEIWRFGLMLEGRTRVLSGEIVRVSDVLVAASGIAVLVAAVSAMVVGASALAQAHTGAVAVAGRARSRTTFGVLCRLLVPIWNIYGAGQIVMEIDRMLASVAEPEGRQRRFPVTAAWWSAWALSCILVLAALVRGLGGSLQAIADTVELHIAVDLAAAAVAVLTVVLFRRFVRLFSPPDPGLGRWMVRAPEPTRLQR